MKLWKSIAAATALTLVSLSAVAADYKVGDLTLSNAWTRATPPKAKAGGGFVEIVNHGGEGDRLIAASSDVSGKTEIHEMAVTDGVMKMRQLENGIEIPAGETVTLKPGGLHIMFMGLNQSFEQGSAVPVVLTFEKAGDVTIELDVAKMGAKSMHGKKMDHSEMDHSKMDHDKMDHSKN
ncbi:MAG: copper chaperone PCu(A)C [Roseibium sp.]|uniref:copper chaperone PCu(A)C n=1 Tax=Roseibium sp. TaxID=1936156 RepID=UPI001B042615|nr:copper chaperone PCu(A)C [Roseibium sp.]MBO6510943.1 copper chaperone PCu(A)C [Roseibium sp.]MBO6890762.1 copper chaperone PCu(A)C [Roseibium sp.]MBO6930361.1 copper chaperone PCu(A)C [Roseibium sp.]